MGEIVHFVGRAERSAKENLEHFIAHARTNTPFRNVDWTTHSWNITSFIIGRNQGRKKKTAHFKAMRCPSGSRPNVVTPLAQPFLDFAKAAFSEIMRRFKLQEYGRHLYALQAIEQALVDDNEVTCITKVTPDILDSAAELLKKRFKDAWCVGRVLERLTTEVINPARLTPVPLEWRSPIPYTQPIRNDRVAPKQSEDVVNRLPSIESILALADIHYSSSHAPDRITTCFVTLAMFAPSRGSEVLSLPTKCIRHADAAEGPIMGLMWAPAKGADPLTKFTASDEFEKVAQEAINYLIDLGAPARMAARWYAENPGKLFLPEGFEHLRGQPVTLFEISGILGRDTKMGDDQAKFFGLRRVNLRTTDPARLRGTARWYGLYDFDSLEEVILGKLPEIFPILDGETLLKWHEALFVLPANILRPDACPLRYVPENISIGQINNQLGANPGGRTVFSRNNKVNPDGSPIAVTTHDFRHLLNTLAQSKYLSEALIAFWSGRKSIRQNEWYDHLPQEAFIEAYLKLGGQAPQVTVHGHLEAKVHSIAATHGLSQDEALRLELGATHRTRYGICRHDYALTPCPKDKDCVNCSEHTFVKGDARHLAEAEFQFKLHEKAVADAQRALDAEEPGADRWLKLHKPKLERWRLVLQNLNDPSIPDGTLITLPPPENAQSKTGLALAIRLVTSPSEASGSDGALAADVEAMLGKGVM